MDVDVAAAATANAPPLPRTATTSAATTTTSSASVTSTVTPFAMGITIDDTSSPSTIVTPRTKPETPHAHSIASIVAPFPDIDDLDLDDLDEDISMHSPAVSTLLLASTTAPSVPPVVSATGIVSPIARPLTAEAVASGASISALTGAAKATRLERFKPQMGMNGGRWTEQEHQSFLAGLRLYGREWKKVASKIKTRTSAQIRSHAQKYFAKLARDDEVRKHNGLQPLLSDGVATMATVSQPAGACLFGYYSDDGSTAAVHSGDDGDTDSSIGPQCVPPVNADKVHASNSSSANAMAAAAAVAFPLAGPASSLAALFSGAASHLNVSHATAPTKKRSRISSTSTTKQRKATKVAKDASAVALLPSQEELLEKVSPTVRRRLSSLIEAELCALQVLSCSALLQRQSGGSRATRHAEEAVATHSELRRLSPAHSAVVISPSATGQYPVQPTLGRTMLATEQFPSVSSIY